MLHSSSYSLFSLLLGIIVSTLLERPLLHDFTDLKRPATLGQGIDQTSVTAGLLLAAPGNL